MVQSTVEKLSPTRVKIAITVTPDELKPSIQHAYKHIAETVNIPGFRKGKVPPPIIDQRVGRGEVLNHAVTESLDTFYRAAIAEQGLRALGRPQADVAEWPSAKDFSGDLLVTVEVDVRPEFEIPKYDGLKIEVDATEVSPDEVETELENLRSRFGTLVTVDRPAAKGDFVQLDLIATVGGTTVDTANSISYELGSAELIEGIDDAVDTLTAGETTTFESKLLGGDHEGEMAQIEVTVISVKERELPEADNDFAQIASQFDTIGELRADVREQLLKQKSFGQGAQARDKLLAALLEKVEIPVPDSLVEGEVNRHLENEGRLEDDAHRAEVTTSSTTTFRTQIFLDALAEKEEVKVSQDELTQYLIQGAAQYGMEPGEFIKVLDQNGQVPGMVGEVARSKALSVALSKVKVVDSKGKVVDLTAFTAAAVAPVAEAMDADHNPGHDRDEHEGHDH